MDLLILTRQTYLPIIIIGLALIAYIFIKNAILTFFRKVRLDTRKKNVLHKIAIKLLKYLLIFITTIAILEILGISTIAILLLTTMIILIIGLAIQDVIKDIFGGAFIILGNYYEVGNVVEINDIRGEIVGIGLKTTKIKSETGEIITIYNRKIDKIINYSLSNNFININIWISKKNDSKKVLRILDDFCSDVNETVAEIVKPLGIKGIINSNEKSNEYLMTCEVLPGKSLVAKNLIQLKLYEKLEKNKIDVGE